MKIYVFLFLLFILSCQNSSKDIPSVEVIDINYELVRYEQLFSTLSTEEEVKRIEAKYPEFSSIYLSKIMNFANTKGDTIYMDNIIGFNQDSIIKDMYKRSQELFGETNEIKVPMTDALKRLKLYFPEIATPDIYTYISGLAYQGFIFSLDPKDGIALGLDYFLGSNFPYKKLNPNNPNFSNYITKSFNKDHLIKKAMEIWIDDYIGEVKGNNLLAYLIHKGKEIYTLEQLIPTAPDSILLGFSETQTEWCEKNQKEMWRYLITNNLFFESNIKKINRLMNPAPSTPGMPKESPGQAVNYLGWQIVKKFAARNPNMSLPELIALDDPQLILDNSKYKP